MWDLGVCVRDRDEGDSSDKKSNLKYIPEVFQPLPLTCSGDYLLESRESCLVGRNLKSMIQDKTLVAVF
jgi:hypothetical protein